MELVRGGRPAYAADVMLDVDNIGTGRTTIQSKVDQETVPFPSAVLQVKNTTTGFGMGLYATSYGTGVYGETVLTGDGVRGVTERGRGVFGTATGPGGVGVRAEAIDPGGVALHAICPDGVGLVVQGTSRFDSAATFEAAVSVGANVNVIGGVSALGGFGGAGGGPPTFGGSGRGRIARGKDRVTIQNEHVTRATNVLVMFQSDPGEIAVKHVRAGAGMFEVVLTGPLANPAQIAYFLFRGL